MSKPFTHLDHHLVHELKASLPEDVRKNLQQAIDCLVEVKSAGGKVAVVTGSGPNLHEGVTTLLAELIRVGMIDGVTTSAAVVAHEMAGTLDRVKRVDGAALGLPAEKLPLGGHFELSLLAPEALQQLEQEIPLNQELIQKLERASGDVIIKAAGNMAYPMGYRTERIATEVLQRAKIESRPFEEVAGRGADPRTMLGAGYRAGVPVLVSIPQLVGGGGVGLAIGDSISVTERSARVARILSSADVILESAVALTQEIHDGPFETFTGHGVWADWDGHPTFSLQNKTLIRFDLDPNLQTVCDLQQSSATVQTAINQGLPKTKLLKIPFRMEMSGFARLPGSIPVIGDIGALWPILAYEVATQLHLDLQFLSYPQQTPAGQALRDAIVNEVTYLNRARMLGKQPLGN